MKITASKLAAEIGGELVGQDVLISGSVQIDSRDITPGGLYVARIGENADGHDFIDAAQAAGAVCAIVQRHGQWPLPYIVVEDATFALGLVAQTWINQLRKKNSQLRVVAVTGSAGKTSTKDLLVQILSRRGHTVANERSLNNETGMPLTALRAQEDTEFLILEMGADAPGNLRYLTQFVAPDVAIELLVGAAHLGGFGNVEALAETKAELLQGIAPGGTAVLNYDDQRVKAMKVPDGCQSIGFSQKGNSGAQVTAEAVDLNSSGHATFTLKINEESCRITLGLTGRHHVMNALAAAAAATALGLRLDEIGAALNGAQPLSPHRMQVFTAREALIVDDSYNANPDSMRAGIRASAHLAANSARCGVLKAIFGQMLELGPSSAQLHAAVAAEALAAGVQAAIVVGENALPLHQALAERIPAQYVAGWEEAWQLLTDFIAPGDTVLIKGSHYSGVCKIAEELLTEVEEA